MNRIKRLVRFIIKKIIWHSPHKMAHSFVYWNTHGKKSINWENPQTYDELIHYFIVKKYDSSYGKYADKYAVREYVKECGLEHILIPMVSGPYNTIEDVDFFSMPKEFVIKTTHASGPNHYYICNDNNCISVDEIKRQFNIALNEDFAKKKLEYHYSSIKHRIIIEELLHDTSDRMNDYKIVCSYGVPIAILVCSNRDEGRDYFDLSWEPLYFTKEEFRSKSQISKPIHLSEMLNAASTLSKPFPLVRIDFYDIEDGVYFGEITLSPAAGDHKNLNMDGQIGLRNKIVEVLALHDSK